MHVLYYLVYKWDHHADHCIGMNAIQLFYMRWHDRKLCSKVSQIVVFHWFRVRRMKLENEAIRRERATRGYKRVSSAINGDHAYESWAPAGASYEDCMYACRTSCRLKTKEQQECKGRNVIVATPSSSVCNSHEPRVRSSCARYMRGL